MRSEAFQTRSDMFGKIQKSWILATILLVFGCFLTAGAYYYWCFESPERVEGLTIIGAYYWDQPLRFWGRGGDLF